MTVFYIAFFLMIIADGIMGYVFPIVVERDLGSNTLMGIIMALSSVTGLICDFVFPSLISNKNWKQLLTTCIILAFLFPLASYLGESFQLIGFFVIATIIWGLYYEFLAFSQQNYIVEKDKARDFSKDWGFLAVLISIMEVITPILGSTLLILSASGYPFFVSIILTIALFTLLLSGSVQSRSEMKPLESTSKQLIRLVRELKVWDLLSPRVWQVLVVSFVLQTVFAAYWVFGGLFGQQLVGDEGFDWIVMFLYAVPCLIASILLSRYLIKRRKKFFTHLLLIFGGLFMISIMFLEGSLILMGIAIFLSSFMFALAYPLNNAVFSDLGVRLGKERNHLFGMINAVGSVAYITVPVVLGIISDAFSYYFAFSFIGFISFIVGLFLIFTTPKKLRLPQKELSDNGMY